MAEVIDGFSWKLACNLRWAREGFCAKFGQYW